MLGPLSGLPPTRNMTPGAPMAVVYMMSTMQGRQKASWLRTVVLLIVAITLLLALLIPHAVNHSDSAVALVVLVPIFPFGIIQEKPSRPSDRLDEVNVRPAPCRGSLFQRPPPPLPA